MITGDLDRQLAAALTALAADGRLPAAAAQFVPGGTWRPGPDGDPLRYATSLPFELARRVGSRPDVLAEALSGLLRELPWISCAGPAGDGYLSVTITPAALAGSAARMAAAGSDCAASSVLRGSAATVLPWPDLSAAADWPQAWQAQADTMTGRLAQAAGATATITSEWERAGQLPRSARQPGSPVQAAVAYLGASSVRYQLARTLPGNAAGLAQLSQARTRAADPLYPLQQAHADAASTLRWAADLAVERPGQRDDELARLLAAPGELALLGLLSWLPVRVASAARRRRPDEVPRYLEQVAASWLDCKQVSPALPFGGRAAPEDPLVAAARLLLADAVRAVIAAGLALTGISASGRL